MEEEDPSEGEEDPLEEEDPKEDPSMERVELTEARNLVRRPKALRTRASILRRRGVSLELE